MCPETTPHSPPLPHRRAHSVLPGAVLAGMAAWPAQVGPKAPLTVTNWMVISYIAFFIFALTIFIAAWKRGLFRDVEDAKYYMLNIDEPDYFTPDWAREEEHGLDEFVDGDPELDHTDAAAGARHSHREQL